MPRRRLACGMVASDGDGDPDRSPSDPDAAGEGDGRRWLLVGGAFAAGLVGLVAAGVVAATALDMLGTLGGAGPGGPGGPLRGLLRGLLGGLLGGPLGGPLGGGFGGSSAPGGESVYEFGGWQSDNGTVHVEYGGGSKRMAAGDVVVEVESNGTESRTTWAAAAGVPPDEPLAEGSTIRIENASAGDVILVTHAPPDGTREVVFDYVVEAEG